VGHQELLGFENPKFGKSIENTFFLLATRNAGVTQEIFVFTIDEKNSMTPLSLASEFACPGGVNEFDIAHLYD
jgi:hypothetical protein